MKKKVLSMILAGAAAASLMAGCSSEKSASTSSGSADNGDKPYVAMISKGFENAVWQTAYQGALDAAEDYGVELTFEGPASETDVSAQVDMVKAALAKNPDVLCIAALDVTALQEQLNEAKEKGIPVIGFDSGVPEAPEGCVYSTAGTDNYYAGQYAAEEMFAEESFHSRIENATASEPVAIAVQTHDATSSSHVDRANGFIDRMIELIDEIHPDATEVTGHEVFNREAENDAVVTIKVTVPPTTVVSDAQAVASTMLNTTDNLIGYFTSAEVPSTSVLAATNDGLDLDRETGKYKDLIFIGFDSGSVLKDAVRKGYMYGGIGQNSYNYGYKPVELAYQLLNGEEIPESVDTGFVFYTAENVDDPEVEAILYD